MLNFLLFLLIRNRYCIETVKQHETSYQRSSPELYWKCSQNISSCTSHNFNNQFQVPVDYNVDHAPASIVDLEVGLFYNALTFLGEFWPWDMWTKFRSGFGYLWSKLSLTRTMERLASCLVSERARSFRNKLWLESKQKNSRFLVPV